MVSNLAELLFDRCDNSIRESIVNTWFVQRVHIHFLKVVA